MIDLLLRFLFYALILDYVLGLYLMIRYRKEGLHRWANFHLIPFEWLQRRVRK